MTLRRPLAILAVAVAAVLPAQRGSAGCVNKFVARPEGGRQVITLLTGKLTFDEAKALAAAIDAGKAPPIEWVSEAGRTVTRQFGSLKVVRPMPVGCDGKTSGTVAVVTFISPVNPGKKLLLKLDGTNTVAFDEQTD